MTTKTKATTGTTTSYTYDHRNRLIHVAEKTSDESILNEMTLVYDVLNRRISKITSDKQTHTLYDRENVWADFDQDGKVLAFYWLGGQMDELIARYRPNEGTVWYASDKLGTVRDLIDSSGTIISHIDYDSFGTPVTITNSSVTGRFLFTGREYDAEIASYYYRARYYDPAVGRFTTQDSLGFDANDMNLYRYIGNSPLSGTDPTGLTAFAEESRLTRISNLAKSSIQCVGRGIAIGLFVMGIEIGVANFDLVISNPRPSQVNFVTSKLPKAIRDALEELLKLKKGIGGTGGKKACSLSGKGKQSFQIVQGKY